MERGPMVLFGAIVAVGLGPAMWLGAQFGQVTVTPLTPPPAIIADSTPGKAAGGAGAAPDALTADADTDPVTELIPLPATTSVRPSAGPAGPVGTGSPDPTTSPSPSSAAPTGSTGPATPSTESTTSATAEPTPDDTEPTSPATLPPPDQQGTSATGDVSPPVV